MKKQYISIATAKLLKEIDYSPNIQKYWCNYYSGEPVNKWKLVDFENLSLIFCEFPAPELWELQKWLRETHQLHITITSISQESWQYHITRPGEPLGIVIGEDYYAYEEALEEALHRSLTLIN